MRSSAVGEDSDGASFAGIHKSLLNVCGTAALVEAVREVHASATEAGAVAYRGRMGLTTALRMAVVVQQLVDAEVGGVMFTRNPVNGRDERVIEAAWGLGEAVVSGMVTPDRYLVDPTGRVLERRVGEKDIAVRRIASGGTREEPVSGDVVYAPCLHDRDLAELHELALRCDGVFGMTRARHRVRLHEPDGSTCFSGARSPVSEDGAARGLTAACLTAALMPLNSTMIAVAIPDIATDVPSQLGRRHAGPGPTAISLPRSRCRARAASSATASVTGGCLRSARCCSVAARCWATSPRTCCCSRARGC